MSVGVRLLLLALACLPAASCTACEGLTKPLEDQSQVTGKWIFTVGTSDSEERFEELKKVNTSWIEITSVPDSNEMSLHWADRIDGKCVYGSTNYSLSGNRTSVTFHFNSTVYQHVGNHLATCPYCILWTDTCVTRSQDGATKEGRNLYLFTKSGTLQESDLKKFKRQAACLDFPPDYHFGDSGDLCPEADGTKDEEQ